MKRAMDLTRVIGSCLPLFFLAVVFDIVGIILLFLGIFANLRIQDRFYGDFLIYTGSIILFFSLGMWLMWYAGNLQVHDGNFTGLKQTSSIVELARKISQRLSEKLKTEVLGKCVAEEEEEASQMGTPRLKTGRVTWGKSTAYVNEGYEDHEQDAGGPQDSEDKKDMLVFDLDAEETKGVERTKETEDTKGTEETKETEETEETEKTEEKSSAF